MEIECSTDCNHPFILFQYCWSNREMKYAYNYNYIKE